MNSPSYIRANASKYFHEIADGIIELTDEELLEILDAGIKVILPGMVVSIREGFIASCDLK